MSEGYKGHTKIPAVNEFRWSFLKLAKSQDESQHLLTLQLPACAPHVTFVGCTTCEPCCEINSLSNLYQLNTKANKIKSHKIQGNKLIQLQHFLL